jgi:hypothetical protein
MKLKINPNKLSIVRINHKYHIIVELDDENFIHNHAFNSLKEASTFSFKILSSEYIDMQFWDKESSNGIIHDKFLIRNDGKKQKAHIWNGLDTLCRMYSTGGLGTDNYELYDNNLDNDICTMCSNNLKKR